MKFGRLRDALLCSRASAFLPPVQRSNELANLRMVDDRPIAWKAARAAIWAAVRGAVTATCRPLDTRDQFRHPVQAQGPRRVALHR
jgi:hypothetical protein